MSALTKILIVLQLVFALACSVLLVLMVSQQQNYKDELDKANAGRVAQSVLLTAKEEEKKAVDARLLQAQQAVATLTNQLATERSTGTAALGRSESQVQELTGRIGSLQAQVAALTASVNTANASISEKDKELALLRPQVEDLLKKYNELYRSKNEADNQLRAAELAIRKLQEELTLALAAPQRSGAGVPVGGDSQVTSLTTVASQSPVNGRIAKVLESEGRSYIELGLGTRDGLQVDTKLFIYRGSSYVGDAVVTRVVPDGAAAMVVSTKPGATVQVGDMVSTTGE